MASDSQTQPATLKSKVFGLFWGGLIILLGCWMICRPDSPLHPDEMTRARTRLFATILDWIWGIPGGIVIAILGIMVIGGSFMPKKPGEDED